MSSQAAPRLPPGFDSMRDLLDKKKLAGSLVSVIGVVSDFRAPTATRGADWKCQMSLYDESIQYDYEESLEINFFDPRDQMPDAECGDVVVVYQAKVQNRAGSLSLITSRNTSSVYIFSASMIPRPPIDATAAMMKPFKQMSRRPIKAELQHVSFLYHNIDKERLPTKQEFEQRKIQSTNVKEKFSLLQDVRDGRFCDLTVQVVKEPYDRGDKMELWVSDYTENPMFFHHSFSGGASADGKDTDPYGYGAKASKTKPKLESKGWTGPFGKRSMQLTCWEPHASAMRNDKTTNGSWVSLRNVQIRFGHNGANLEGYLREDRGAHGYKIGISPLDPGEDPENIDPRLKETIRRKRDYEKEKKHQLKNITEAAMAGQKRKADMGEAGLPLKPNSKNRRRAQRAQAERKVGNLKQEESVPAIDLNPLVKCESLNKPASSVAQILETVFHETTINGQAAKLPLPFVNTNHRANVRVVDFRPSALEDFARAKKKTSEFDVLSDNEYSDSGSESEQDMMVEFTTIRDWEWCFYLALEDAAVAEGQQKNTVWVAVDNQAAQCLMDLDATNLRHDRQNLDALRQKLFYLWGDLEEHKKRKRSENARKDGPPPDSSDDEDGPPESKGPEQVANRPFGCCLRQYGVKVSEQDPSKADAGEGKRWQRMYGFFGARISGT